MDCVRAFIALLFAFAVVGQQAFADDNSGPRGVSPEVAAQVTPEIAARIMAVHFGLTPQSKFYPAFRDGIVASINNRTREGKLKEKKKPTTKDLGHTKILPVIKHFRSAQGIGFPTEEEMQKKIPWTKKDFEQAAEEVYRDHFGDGQPKTEDPTEAPALERCVENKTDKTPSGYKDKEGSKQVLVDLLMIPPELVPSDLGEAFGEETIVQVYQPKDAVGEAFAAISLGATCLPFRIRATKEFSMRDYGINAIKNYDGNPYGKGKLLPIMEKKWRQ